jgi:predicted metal-dependent hydrolase
VDVLGLGTVVRRVRDLGREVHADHATPSTTVQPPSTPIQAAPPAPEPTRGITDRIISTFGNPFSRHPQEIKQSLVDAEEKIEAVVTPLALATGEKMDQIREKATTKAEELSEQVSERATAAAEEFAHRVDTLPERADPATANPSLATRLLATFGNPRKDDIKAQRDLENVKSSAEQLTHEAAEAVSAAKERLEQVDLQEIKQSLLQAEEKVEQAVTPLAIATAEKMDTLREKATLKAEQLQDEWSRRVDTLPERADPKTANPSLATRLFSTFGNPQKDDLKVQRELEMVKASAGELANEAVEAVGAAKERIEGIDVQEIKGSLLQAEEKVEQAVTPLAVAAAEKMDRLRETATARASHLAATVDSRLATTTEAINARLEALPQRGVDNPAQGIDPVLASRIVATFGNAEDDARLTRREVGDAVGMGNVVRMEEGVAAAKEGVAVAKEVVSEAVDKVEKSVEQGRGKSWWRL